MFTEEISLLYYNDFYKVKLHKYKTTGHTSKSATAFLEKIAIDADIKHISFQYILAKSSNVLSIDYCAFGLLERAFSEHKRTTNDGL